MSYSDNFDANPSMLFALALFIHPTTYFGSGVRISILLHEFILPLLKILFFIWMQFAIRINHSFNEFIELV